MSISLDVVDAMEFTQLLQFLNDRLATDLDQLSFSPSTGENEPAEISAWKTANAVSSV